MTNEPSTRHLGGRLRDAAAKPRPEDTPVQIGTPLRDAAVDPRPGDNPPGALTREAQARARGEQLPRPGGAAVGAVRTLRMEPVPVTVAGRLAVTELPVIPADASPALAEGLRRRRVAATLGRCPCGAVRPAPTAVQDAAAEQGQAHMAFPHRADCPAHDNPLGAALVAWQNREG